MLSSSLGKIRILLEYKCEHYGKTLEEALNNMKKGSNNISNQVNKLLEIMEYDIPLNANEIITRLGVKSKQTLRTYYLNPVLENGLIKMTIPNKPNSKKRTGSYPLENDRS